MEITFNLKQVEFMNTVRKLWEQHIMWTRSFIISTAEDLGDLNPVTMRLLRNPTDFENALMPFYGKEKAAKFAELFKEHLIIASQIVNAAKAGDKKAVDEYTKKWFENADAIALFLASINPYWSFLEWKNMMHEHLKITLEEAVFRLNKNYAADVAQYDIIERQALRMADEMSIGIMKQFPSLFVM